MTEVAWPVNARTRAHLRDGYDTMGGVKFLHFEGPPGYPHEVIWVTDGESTQVQGQNVWHYQVQGDVIVVSPSIHFVGHFHSSNPVAFRVDESKWWENTNA